MALDVFLSVGRASTDQQEKFVAAVERLLNENGLVPCRAQWSAVQPLQKIEEVIATCCGTVIIAYERVHARTALEFRGGAKEREIVPLCLPTVWNQIEAAIAYSRHHPLLVLCEEGLRSEGLLEKGYDWNVQWVTIDPAYIDSREFRGVFGDWKQRVEHFAEGRTPIDDPKKTTSAAELTIGELVGSLKPSQLWSALAAIATFIVAVAGVAFKFGQA